jgi:hypothetical protein
MPVTVKFKTKSGPEFEVSNVTSVDWDAHRVPAPNGQIGQRNHNLGAVRLVRRKSLQQGGKVKNETETVKLAAALETKAYFEGTITITSADNSAVTVQTIRWDQGHICGIATSGSDRDMQETLEIAVTNLKVDDVEFKVVPTT